MRYLTAGESHGPRLTAIIEGVPAGLPLTAEDINGDLKRRQGGYGRGGRMKIESDKVEITSGVRHGKTTGAPITLHVINKDHQKWLDIMAVEDIEDRLKTKRKITHPRPGHADLVGGMKYRFDDLRNSLERSSARETTMRVAVGAVAKRILAELDIEIANHVVVFGGKEIDVPENLTVAQIKELAQQSEISVVNQEREQEIKDYSGEVGFTSALLDCLASNKTEYSAEVGDMILKREGLERIPKIIQELFWEIVEIKKYPVKEEFNDSKMDQNYDKKEGTYAKVD